MVRLTVKHRLQSLGDFALFVLSALVVGIVAFGAGAYITFLLGGE